jgi:hypothetical protein
LRVPQSSFHIIGVVGSCDMPPEKLVHKLCTCPSGGHKLVLEYQLLRGHPAAEMGCFVAPPWPCWVPGGGQPPKWGGRWSGRWSPAILCVICWHFCSCVSQ